MRRTYGALPGQVGAPRPIEQLWRLPFERTKVDVSRPTAVPNLTLRCDPSLSA